MVLSKNLGINKWDVLPNGSFHIPIPNTTFFLTIIALTFSFDERLSPHYNGFGSSWWQCGWWSDSKCNPQWAHEQIPSSWRDQETNLLVLLPEPFYRWKCWWSFGFMWISIPLQGDIGLDRHNQPWSIQLPRKEASPIGGEILRAWSTSAWKYSNFPCAFGRRKKTRRRDIRYSSVGEKSKKSPASWIVGMIVLQRLEWSDNEVADSWSDHCQLDCLVHGWMSTNNIY